MLESFCENLSLLISLRKLSDGVEATSSTILTLCGEFLHFSFHLALIILWCLHFIAVGLMVSFRHRTGGRGLLSVVVPAVAALASLSALSLPAIPECPAVQHGIGEYFATPLFFHMLTAVFRKSSTSRCPGCFRSIDRVLIAAWLSVPSAKEVLPFFSVLIRYIPRRRPTSSASCMVCSVSLSRWKCRVRGGCPCFSRTVAAPTLPLFSELSEYTLIASGVLVASVFDSSLLLAILVCRGVVLASNRLCTIAVILVIDVGLSLKICIR